MNYDDIKSEGQAYSACVPEEFPYEIDSALYRAVLVGKRFDGTGSEPVYVFEAYDGRDALGSERWLRTRESKMAAFFVHEHIRPMRKKIACLEAENAQLLTRAK